MKNNTCMPNRQTIGRLGPMPSSLLAWYNLKVRIMSLEGLTGQPHSWLPLGTSSHPPYHTQPWTLYLWASFTWTSNTLLFHLRYCYFGFSAICGQNLFGLYAREFMFKGSSTGLEAALEQQSNEGPVCVWVWGGVGGSGGGCFTGILGVFGAGRNLFSPVKDKALGRLFHVAH